MGEETFNDCPLLSETRIGMPGLAKASAEIAARHGLKQSAELELLVDRLSGLACRDQEERYSDRKQMAERRREGFRLAKKMQTEAAVILAGLKRLHDAYQDFHAAVRFNPSLLEAIFDVDTGGPEELLLPSQLSILQTAFFDNLADLAFAEWDIAETAMENAAADPAMPCPPFLWESVDARLQQLAELPVKDSLSRGPVPNALLAKAVTSCRSFWTEHEQRSWTMSSLKVAAVRAENDVATLQGACERFVADALREAGLQFNLTDLSSSWDAVDKAMRPQNKMLRNTDQNVNMD